MVCLEVLFQERPSHAETTARDKPPGKLATDGEQAAREQQRHLATELSVYQCMHFPAAFPLV